MMNEKPLNNTRLNDKKDARSCTTEAEPMLTNTNGSAYSKLEEIKETQYDIFVVGGGSGGLGLVKEAAELGAKVGIADYVKPSSQGTRWGLGGTCANVGCIPKKLMHYASLCGDSIHEQKSCGWELPEKMQHNWTLMQSNVARHIKSLNWGYKAQLKEKGVTYFNKMASFIDSHTLLVRVYY